MLVLDLSSCCRSASLLATQVLSASKNEPELLQLENQTSLAKQCTPKQAAFVREYVVDFNGTNALIRTGLYNVSSVESAGTIASRLLQDVKVQALIQIVKEQRSARVNVTADHVLQEMALLANSDVSHYFIDDEGQVKLNEGAPEGAMRAIQKVKRKKTVKEDREGNVTITYDIELTLWDKPTPLKLMGKHIGLFNDKMELSGPGGRPLQIEIGKIERVIVDPAAEEDAKN